uniref:Uncharacterized protein n=1 Tax=Romanomermis culicivorax TaxID=13658 RepID=A0A915IU39_ROMCU
MMMINIVDNVLLYMSLEKKFVKKLLSAKTGYLRKLKYKRNVSDANNVLCSLKILDGDQRAFDFIGQEMMLTSSNIPEVIRTRCLNLRNMAFTRRQRHQKVPRMDTFMYRPFLRNKERWLFGN